MFGSFGKTFVVIPSLGNFSISDLYPLVSNLSIIFVSLNGASV